MGYTPKYVLDEMQMYEILPIIEHLHLKVKDDWEQARFIGWSNIAPHQKNPKPIEEFLQFSWENNEHETTQDINNIEDMKEQAKNIERVLNNGK